MHKMRYLTNEASRGRNTTPERHVPTWLMCHFACCISGLGNSKKKNVSDNDNSEQPQPSRSAGSKGSQGTTGSAGHRKKTDKRKGRLFRFT